VKDESKTKKQLICELLEYRQRVSKLEALEGLYRKVNKNSDLLSYSKSQAKPDQYLLRENQEILEYLTRSRLFSHLPKRILEQLLPVSHLEDYPSGSEILIEGAINTKVFFLIRGAVSVYAGGNKISELRRKGDIFGEMSIISNKPCSASIIAQTPVRLFSVKAKHIGEYTDIETNELDNILYRIFAMILTEKLSLTNKKAQQYETIHKDLLREINDRKLSENLLRRSEALLNATQQIAKVGGWEWDVKNESMFWTDEVYRIHDFNPEHYVSDSADLTENGLKCYDQKDRPFIINAFQQCAEQGKAYDIEVPFTTATDRRIWIRTVARPVLKDDRVIMVVGNIMDISARKKAEQSLQNANDELEKKVEKRTKELLKTNKLLKSEIEERKKADQQLLNSHEQLHDLTRHLQSSKEQERIHIAREIHDDLGQNLTAIKINLSWLATKIDKDQKQLIQKTGTTIDLADQTIKTVRKIISELRPGLLDELGLVAAIEWYAEEFINRTGIQVQLEIDPSEINLHTALSTTIFRIFQECMTNVSKHSQATNAKVILTEKDTLIKLTVSDNGIGINEENASDRNAFGILGIKERVHIFNGEMEIDSLPGKGTIVSVAIGSNQGFE
jgi:signal transduction histidine kinase/CRP-like cAMP-binding protein